MSGTERSDSRRWVATRAIQAAVKGRETELLDALGIAWRDGRPHISCPYPAHADGDPSWRWDEAKARARCTCCRGDSIFDVLIKFEGIDFEAAKLRAAELLGRGDLIQEATGQPRFQALDAASLLRPPPDQRDDSLPMAYLAFRLDVAVDQVPRPRTEMTGFKALAYFDPPPPGSRAKPKLIGTHPCAIFGTVAADGRRHAHRIYVAHGGAGKAELGIGPNGRPRDPKKSAKLTGEQSTAGCAVLWGDPASAPHLLVTEGIETGAAVAYAVQPELEEGRVAVAAAISAVGMEAFEPWPANTRVTLAADRDEGDKLDGRKGSRRGEQAARCFGLRHEATIEVAIALPGLVGESVDWLDVLRREGVDAVRDGLLAAEPFQSSPAERAAEAEKCERLGQLEEVSRTYPLPEMDTVELSYGFTNSGKVKVHKLVGFEKDPETGEKKPVLIPISTPFGVPARLRLAEQGEAFGLRVLVEDMAGAPRSVDFDRADLPRLGAAEIRARVFAAGLRTEGDGEAVVVQALKAADPKQEIIILRRPGWHCLHPGEAPLFIMPSGEVIGAARSVAAELQVSTRLNNGSCTAGSLTGWQSAIAAALNATNCPHWVLGVVAGFAGTIVDLVQLDSCGVNQSGPSSRGKSTAQRLAASAWSSPRLGAGGLFRSMRVSENAVEAWAEQANGTVLLLDDLGHSDGRVVARLIYALAGGIGKGRMRADTSIRPSYRWATFTLLSAEHSLEETVRRTGGIWQAGMAVRIADVDVTTVNANVDDTTIAAIAAIDRHHGHAGHAFVRALVEDGVHRYPEQLRDSVFSAARQLAGPDAPAAAIRAATSFAVLQIAGELARAARILPVTAAISEAVRWAWDRFIVSSDASALDPAEQAICQLQLWLLERWDVTVKHVKTLELVDGGDGRGHMNNREALAWYDENAVYLPSTRTTEACGGALKPEALARVLFGRGMLARRTDDKRLTIRYVSRLGSGSWYALCRKSFGRTSAADAAFTVHEGGRA